MRILLASVAALTMLLAGCTSEGSSAPEEPAASEPGEATSPPARGDLLARCLPEVGAEKPVTAGELEPAPGVTVPLATWGDAEDSGTVLILLHQTDRDGLCGWTPFAREVAERGMTALAFDMCGWGDSECPDEWSLRSSDQIAHAVDHARTALDADRVVLVGASLGAARTVFALADGVRPDAWVYLSGPPAWDGREVASEAAGIDVPGLVLHDPEDGDAEYAASRATARAAGAEFVAARGGHGYDILWDADGSLTPLGLDVLDYAAG